MSEYPSPDLLIQLLRQRGHRRRKQLGQHFMADVGVLDSVVDALDPDDKTLAVEIGPGPCTLTTRLAPRTGGIVCIEKDYGLRSFHESVFPGRNRMEFIYEDALQVPLARRARELAESWELERFVLTGNIPYQITSPLLFGQVGPDVPWETIVFMIQKEVADRILATPKSRDYGILTVKLSYWWRTSRVEDVPSRLFTPPPKVDSTIVKFERTGASQLDDADEWPKLSKFIDLAFNQRRKKLYNSPAAAALGKEGGTRMRQALEAIGVQPDVRPEEVDPHNYLRLFRELQ